MSTRTTRAVVGAATLVLIGGAALAAAPTASADTLNVTYDASGSTFVAKPKSTIALGPTTLSTSLNPDGTFTGSLPFPPAQASFKVLGFIPTQATVSFLPAGPLTGTLASDPDTGALKVTSVAKYTLKLSNVKLGGIPTNVGDKCLSSSVVSIPVSTPAGSSFDVLEGGTVTGTYTIPKFANCGLTTGLINLLVPGPGNTVKLTLSNGRLSS